MTQTRTRQDAIFDKRAAVKSAEASGLVADSMDVRGELIKRFQRGEATLAEIQTELAAIKKSAKRNGQKTRSQIYNAS